ncbi:MAG: glycosyltransferase, partial [Flavobacterium sp.]
VNERKLTKKWVKEYGLHGIISDNRLGVHSKKVPSVFITHQLNVLTGNTSWISSKIHQYIIKKYDECWVPDVETKPNLSGKLGHLKHPHFKISYIGPLSRLEKKEYPIQYDVMVLLSGPEPQRGMLEALLLEECSKYQGKVLFVKGVVSGEQTSNETGSMTLYNYMTTDQLEQAIQESKLILCRSGYTTVMDLAKLGKKAYFIPTPGQFEQEYLAKKYKKEGWVPYSKQEKFRIENLFEIDLYKGLPKIEKQTDWKQLLLLFEGKREL